MKMNVAEERMFEEPSAEELMLWARDEQLQDVSVDGADYHEDTMRAFLLQIGRIPLLTAEEERELGARVQAGGDGAADARNRLVESNLRLVVHYAKKYLGRGVDFEDLNVMGQMGLMKAAEKYDYTLGYRFSTYASWWINQAIMRGISDEATTVRVPVHMNEVIHKVMRAQKQLEQQSGEEATEEELAEAVGCSVDRVHLALQSMHKTVSMETKVGEDEESTLEEFIRDENAVDPCEAAIRTVETELLHKVLETLHPREAKVLCMRYGIGYDHPMTLEEIAKHPDYQVTRERIRQIEAKGMRKLHHNARLRRMFKER